MRTTIWCSWNVTVWFSGSHFIAACTVSPTRHSTWSIKQMHTYWPLLCLLYSIQRIKTAEAVVCYTHCCLILKLRFLLPRISVQKTIPSEGKSKGNAHLSSKSIFLRFAYLSVSNVHIFVYKSAVRKPIFFGFHSDLIISKYRVFHDFRA